MVPHQSCFLWYMNSSGLDGGDANVEAHEQIDVEFLSLGRQGRGGTEIRHVQNPAFEELLVPSKVLVFRLSRDRCEGWRRTSVRLPRGGVEV
ncbi:unnamed protein product [Ectocarpus sp. 8 AP-2014]